MVELRFNFEKKHLYFLVLMFGIAVGILVVNAYNSPPYPGTQDPAVFGHSVDEMDFRQGIKQNVYIEGGGTGMNDVDLVIGGTGGADVSGGLASGGAAFGNNIRTTTGTDLTTAVALTSTSVGDMTRGYGYAGMWAHRGQIDFLTAPGNTLYQQDISANSRMTLDSAGKLTLRGNLDVGGSVAVVGNVDVSGVTRTKGLMYTGQVTSTRMIWGRVWHDGSISLGGSGQWGSSKASQGRYIINFNPCFAATPVFTGNAHSPLGQGIPNPGIIRTVQTNNISTCYADIFTGDTNGNAQDVPFQFTIIGPNLP